MTLILLLLYPLAVQYERGGYWRLLFPVTFCTLIIDVVANWTELSLAFWEFPRYGEWTFSTRLERLIHGYGWRSDVARFVAHQLNAIYPGHIRGIF
jgi:hypothetical protein